MEPLTIWETFERSRVFFSQKTALVFVNADGEAKFYSYNRLFDETEIFARGLKESGIGKGDNVCLCLPNSPLLITAYLALSKLGAVSVMLNPALPEKGDWSTRIGGVAEWTMAPDCKSGVRKDYEGSNPSPSTWHCGGRLWRRKKSGRRDSNPGPRLRICRWQIHC